MAVTVVDMPVTLPAKCLSCGSPYSSDGRKYVDLHLDVERYGRLYICTLCMSEVARYMDYVSREEVADLQVRADTLITTCDKLIGENNDLRSHISGLLGLGFVDTRNAEFKARLESIEDILRAVALHPIFSERADNTSSAIGELYTENRKLGPVEPSKGFGLVGVPTDVEIGNDTA